jgi:hypothetical protein
MHGDAYVRVWEIVLLHVEMLHWGDRKVTSLVLVKDAREDGRGVKVRYAV